MKDFSFMIDYSISLLIGLFVLQKLRLWILLKKRKSVIVEKVRVWNGFFAVSALFIGVTHGWQGGIMFGSCTSSSFTGFLGVVLAALGFGLNFWAERALGRMWHMDAVVFDHHEIVRNGPYRWLAHPIYVAEFLILVGMALHNLNGAGLVFASIFLIEMVRRCTEEQRLLQKYFPKAYPAYLNALPWGRRTKQSGQTGSRQNKVQ